MELIYQHPSVIEILKVPIIIIICIILIPIAILIIKKILPVEESSKKEIRVTIIIVSLVIMLFFGYFLFGRIGYAFDVATNNKVVIETVLPNLSGDNVGDYFYYNKKRITLGRNQNPTENIQEYFLGNLCEIEYYKFSRNVTRITLVGNE